VDKIQLYAKQSRKPENSTLKDQLILLKRQLWVVIGGNVGASVVTALVLWSYVGSTKLVLWVVAIYAWTLLRGIALYRFTGESSLNNWARLFVFFSLVSGLLWGSLAILFLDPSEPVLVVFICILLMGMTAASVSSLSAYSPTYFAYAIPTMLLLGWALYSTGGLYTGLGVLSLASLAVNLLFSKNFERSVKETISLRFEKASLVEKLEKRIKEVAYSRDIVKQANLAKSKFLAAASHDVRQPLHALSLFVDSLHVEEDEQERRKLVKHIDDSVQALSGLFDGLLDISRLDAAVVEVIVGDFAIHDLFSELQSEFERIATQKGIELRVRPANLNLRTDAFLLQRVLRNLLSNAVRYTQHGGVLLAARSRGDEVWLEIRDTGSGIPLEEQKNIFMEFHQLDNPERDRRKGLGLGLAIVQRLCTLLKLPLEVHSWPDQGSLFRVRVPRGHATATETPRVDPGIRGNLEGRRILLVDDEKTIIDAIVPVLSRWGCQVKAVSNLAETLAAAKEISPDVIICDYRLQQGTTGFEVIELLRKQQGKNVPALMITGDTAPEILQRADQSNIELLHKPVLPAKLRIVLSHLLQTETH